MAGRKSEDLTGKRYGKWKVLHRDPTNKRPRARWICKCECGKVFPVYATNLRSGHSKSCGCEQRRTNYLRKAPKTYGLDERTIKFITIKLRSQDDELRIEEAYRNYY